MLGSSFPLIGSSSTQAGPQLSSPVQLQQRQQSSLEERNKASVQLSNYMKPVLSAAGQPSVVPPSDTSSTQKACTEIIIKLFLSWRSPYYGTKFCLQSSLLLLGLTFSSIMQPQSTANASSALSSSTGFVRPSRAATSASKYMLFLHMSILFTAYVYVFAFLAVTMSCVLGSLGFCCVLL